MRVNAACRLAVVLTAFLWMVGIPGAARGQAEAQAPGPAKSNSSRWGVWHRFGESQKAPAAGHSELGVWRRFGESGNPKRVTRGSPARPSVGVTRVRELEEQMYELINRERADPANAAETGGRAQPLRWDPKLAAVARAHSQDMLRQGFYGHVDPEGRSPAMRVEAAGMVWQRVGENIAIYPGVAGAQAAFMNEPRFRENHRGNILNPKYTSVGIGIVPAPGGKYYITQDFLEPPTDEGGPLESSAGAGNREATPSVGR